MFTLTSGPPEQVAEALLDIIRNPDLAKKHLDLISAERKAADESVNAARQAMDEARASTQKAAADRAAADQALADVQRHVETIKAEHEGRAKELAGHHQTLVNKQKELDQREALLTKHEDDISRREAEVTKREQEISKLEIEVKATKAEYEERENALRAALSPRK